MMLIPSERKVIEKVFDLKVTNLYGCEEVGLIGCECERHDGMHLNTLNSYIEFIRNDGSYAMPGEEGQIVVTSLINYAMPIIRYKIEDIGIASKRKCRCGRGLPLMEQVSGRTADFLIKKNGSEVAGVSLIERTLTKIGGIKQMQIIQEKVGEIVLNVVKNEKFSEKTKNQLIGEFKHVFGNDVDVKIDYLSEIKPDKSGKYRFSICNVQK